MTRKEQEIKRLEREIEILTQKLEELKSQPEISENSELSSIEDFPLLKGAPAKAFQYKGIITIEDLIYSKPSEILALRGMGIGSLKVLEEWMAKHGLKFLG